FRFIETPIRRDGFRATIRRVTDTVRGAGRGELPQIAAVTARVLVLLAGVAVATAPDKSETQRAIEADEDNLNTPTGAAASRRPAMSGALTGTAGTGDGASGAAPAAPPEAEPAEDEATDDAATDPAAGEQDTDPEERADTEVGDGESAGDPPPGLAIDEE